MHPENLARVSETPAIVFLSASGDTMTLPRPTRLLAFLGCFFAAAAATAGLPAENRCPTMSGHPDDTVHDDAAPTLLREGMLLRYDDVLKLRSLIPVEVWRNRNIFFFEGMQMLIGPCHRRYPFPTFFTEATEKFASQVQLDEDGNLEDYVAGLPFPPDAIDPEATDAGMRWAWNLQMRYRGAGPVGDFRLVDIPASVGAVETFLGSFFYIQTGHRADLASDDYRVSEGKKYDFVTGGRFDEPFNARHLAWRQLRPTRAREKYSKTDETFVYVPTMRKVRRAPTAWVDGVYTPRYRVGGDTGGGGMPLGGGNYTFAGSINPTAGASIATAEHIRQGFSELALRPNAYVWRVLEEREVLAPINSARPGYPMTENRNFGPSGLSVASDRWDVRWAIVVEGLARERGRAFDKIVIYVDYQTQVPLYVMTKRRDNRLIEVGIPVHRFSGDDFNYPTWPNGQRALVFDPVAASFYNASTGGSGWRRESYGVRSVPVEAGDLRRYLSTDTLLKGR